MIYVYFTFFKIKDMINLTMWSAVSEKKKLSPSPLFVPSSPSIMPLRHHSTDARASFLGPSTRFFPLSPLPLFFVVLVIIALSSPASSMDTFYFTDSPRYSDPIVVEGQSATLRCDVNNHHLIRVHWTMNDKEIPDTPRRLQFWRGFLGKGEGEMWGWVGSVTY